MSCFLFQSRHYSSEEDLGDIDFDSGSYILTPRNRTEDNHRRQEGRARARERLDFNDPTATAQKRLQSREDERIKDAEGKKYYPPNTPSSRAGKENKALDATSASSVGKRDRGDGKDIEIIRQSKEATHRVNKAGGNTPVPGKNRGESEVQVYSVRKAEMGSSEASQGCKSPTKSTSVKRRPHIYIKSGNQPPASTTRDMVTPVKSKGGPPSVVRTPIPPHSSDQSARTAAVFKPNLTSRTPGRREQPQSCIPGKGRTPRQPPGAAPATPSVPKPSPAPGRSIPGQKFAVPLTPVSRATPAKFRGQSPMGPKQPQVTSMDDSCE